MSRGNGSEESHSEAGRLARGKGEGVADMGVDERPDGVELKVGVTGVPAAEEARESCEDEVGNDSFRGMAVVVAVVNDTGSRYREERRKNSKTGLRELEGLRNLQVAMLRSRTWALGRLLVGVEDRWRRRVTNYV